MQHLASLIFTVSTCKLQLAEMIREEIWTNPIGYLKNVTFTVFSYIAAFNLTAFLSCLG